MLGIDSTGIYMVAVQLSGAMAIIFDAINKAYVPWLYKTLGENDETEKRRIVSYTFVGYAVILLAAAVTFLASPEASYLTGQTISVNGGMVML